MRAGQEREGKLMMASSTYGSSQALADAWAETEVVPNELRYNPVKVGMLAFLFSEVAFFSALITTYVVFLRTTNNSDPSTADVFNLPWVLSGTACLLASSVTIHFAEHGLRSGNRAKFLGLW